MVHKTLCGGDVREEGREGVGGKGREWEGKGKKGKWGEGGREE